MQAYVGDISLFSPECAIGKGYLRKLGLATAAAACAVLLVVLCKTLIRTFLRLGARGSTARYADEEEQQSKCSSLTQRVVPFLAGHRLSLKKASRSIDGFLVLFVTTAYVPILRVCGGQRFVRPVA